MDIEWWKYIKGYEGLYLVSTKGRVKSVDRYCYTRGNGLRFIKGEILKLQIDKNGYFSIRLNKNNKSKTFRVHRLVAEAFIPNPHNYPTVDHINTIRTDNRVENLRWATMGIQMKNSLTKEHLKGKRTNRKDQSKPVLQYTLDMVFIKEYPSVSEASRQTGVSKSGISSCCQGNSRYSSAGGYIWKYKIL